MELSWGLAASAASRSPLLAAYWHDSLGTRERANAAARETCTATGAALLDGTVAFRASLKVARGQGGGFVFERTYVFDYTVDGYNRRQGFIVMFGPRVDSIGLE